MDKLKNQRATNSKLERSGGCLFAYLVLQFIFRTFLQFLVISKLYFMSLDCYAIPEMYTGFIVLVSLYYLTSLVIGIGYIFIYLTKSFLQLKTKKQKCKNAMMAIIWALPTHLTQNFELSAFVFGVGGMDLEVLNDLHFRYQHSQFGVVLINSISQMLFTIPLTLFNSVLWKNYADHPQVDSGYLWVTDLLITIILCSQFILVFANLFTLKS